MLNAPAAFAVAVIEPKHRTMHCRRMPIFPSYADFRRLELKVDAIGKSLGVVIRHEDFLTLMEKELATTADDIKTQSDTLIAEVAKETNAVAAVTTLVNGLKSQVADLTQQLKDAIANGADPATLQAIADNLTAATASIDANEAAESALANTAPPVTPAPPAPPSALPVIASLTPAVGTVNGGETISINGSNLGGLVGVSFGGVASPSLVADADTVATVVTPPHDAGTVDVVLTTSVGDSVAVPFTFA